METIDIDNMSFEELKACEKIQSFKYRDALRQINHLDNQVHYLRKLFRRAEKNQAYAMRYNLRMQLSIVSGVKVMYHHYAATKEDQLSRMRLRLREIDAYYDYDDSE